MTLVTDAIIDNWDEGVEDAEEYAWVFAQPSSKSPVTANKTSKFNNIKAKQATTLNKVQGQLNPFWILLDNQSTVNVLACVLRCTIPPQNSEG